MEHSRRPHRIALGRTLHSLRRRQDLDLNAPPQKRFESPRVRPPMRGAPGPRTTRSGSSLITSARSSSTGPWSSLRHQFATTRAGSTFTSRVRLAVDDVPNRQSRIRSTPSFMPRIVPVVIRAPCGRSGRGRSPSALDRLPPTSSGRVKQDLRGEISAHPELFRDLLRVHPHGSIDDREVLLSLAPLRA